MTRLIKFLAFTWILIATSCNSEDNSNNEEFTINGTWSVTQQTWIDSNKKVTEKIVMDTLRIQRLSFEENNCQFLNISHLNGLYFVIYFHYSLENNVLSFYPDSLIDSDNVIHYWNSETNHFDDYPVLAEPLVSKIEIQNSNHYKEVRTFADKSGLIISHEKVSDENTDLSLELVKYRDLNIEYISNHNPLRKNFNANFDLIFKKGN